jgi:hypothetical protein
MPLTSLPAVKPSAPIAAAAQEPRMSTPKLGSRPISYAARPSTALAQLHHRLDRVTGDGAARRADSVRHRTGHAV